MITTKGIDEVRKLYETSISGNSRSSGKSKWETYIVPRFVTDNEYKIEIDSKLFDSDLKTVLLNVKKGESIKILSIELSQSGNRKFANIHHNLTGTVGYLSLSGISKPEQKTSNNVIGGGKNSKEFTPDKLDLGGMEFSDIRQAINFISDKLDKKYPDNEYDNIKKLLSDFFKNVFGIGLSVRISEKFTRTFKASNNYDIGDGDLKILSKNFGEVIGALYILKTNKKIQKIHFPENISEGLYDFVGIDGRGVQTYYSSKAGGGSSTSLENLNFIMKHFKDNSLVIKYKNEMEVINSLMNVKGRTTIKNIIEFFKKNFPVKVSNILNIMSSTGILITNLDIKSLDNWFLEVQSKVKSKNFISIMEKIYTEVLGDTGRVPRSTKTVLEFMHKSKRKTFNAGYLIYPMGSYIVSFLNSDEGYIKALNLITGFGSYISQVNVDLNNIEMKIVITTFSKSKFKFSYNGMSKSPGNRPIGFMMKK